MLTENSPLLTNLKMLWIRVLWSRKWGLQIHMWHSGPAATFLGHCKVPVEFCSKKFWKDKRLTLFINKTHTRTCQFTLSLTEGYAEYLFTVSASLLSWPFDTKGLWRTRHDFHAKTERSWLKARQTLFFEHYCLPGSFPILFAQIGKHDINSWILRLWTIVLSWS